MPSIERRAFLLSAMAFASIPSVATTTTSSSSESKRSGILVRAGKGQRTGSWSVLGGLRIDTKVAPTDSGGALFVIEHSDEIQGGPGRHVHHHQDEWFYVLEGEYRVEVGEDRFDLGPGDSVFAPREVPHVWAHVSAGEGRLLIAFQPAGLMESFFNALAEAGSTPPPEAMAALFESHGMTLIGPPLSLA